MKRKGSEFVKLSLSRKGAYHLGCPTHYIASWDNQKSLTFWFAERTLVFKDT